MYGWMVFNIGKNDDYTIGHPTNTPTSDQPIIHPTPHEFLIFKHMAHEGLIGVMYCDFGMVIFGWLGGSVCIFTSMSV